jgi:hypothetical protein
MRYLSRFIAVVASLAAVFAPSQFTTARASGENCLDVAIVLAIDGSSSIDTQEFYLQQQGIIAALRDPTVLTAIRRAGTVAVAILYWGDADLPIQDTPFITIRGKNDIEMLVTTIETMPRRVLGNTGLRMALSTALDKLGTVPCTHRQVINISGDGSDTVVTLRKRLAPSLREIKAQALSANVTINALVVSSDEEDLKSYFEKQVISGPGAFVMEIDGFNDYAEALCRKLVREIGPAALSKN